MTTVKLKIRKSTVKTEEGVIYYQVCHHKKIKHITTNMRISMQDFEQICSTTSALEMEPHLRQLKTKIDNDMASLQEIIRSYENQTTNYTVADIKERFRKPTSYHPFFSYMDRTIKKLNQKEKFGTALNYSASMRSFSEFLHHKEIDLCEMTSLLIKDYSDWLEAKHVSRNTISFYMRNLRAVYNQATKEKLTAQSYPFNEVYTGVDQTRKLAIPENDLYKIIQLNLDEHPSLTFVRDIFLFSFCMRGMAFVDIAFLKKSDIHNHMVSYRRKKTMQLLNVKIEPCMDIILQKYLKLTSDSEFVFPIITTKNTTYGYKQYHIALTNYNRKLKELAMLANVHENLSSYSARHTWATMARNHNIPLSVISEGMGHTSESTTKIYLDSLQNTVVDEANSLILAHLNELISF